MITVLLMLLTWDPTLRVICTSVGGSHLIDTTPGVSTTIPMKCCPEGSFIDDPDHPTDEKGNLICFKEKA